MRIRLDLAYDGTAFHGWARQPGLRTVQGELERNLEVVLRTEGTQLTVAGRTDTGVHARGQVAHFDVEPAVLESVAVREASSVDSLLRRLNGVLDADVRVLRVQEAAEGFDARFSALWRRYAYRIADRPEVADPLQRTQVLSWPRELDVDAMNAAARSLLGEHDFAAFCRKREGATTIRSLLDLQVGRRATGLVVAGVRADAFCHSMVRSLMGCLLAVGEGRQSPEFAAEILGARRRDPRVTVVHPHGLTLEEVGYPGADGLAAQAVRSRARRTLPGSVVED